jgi:hypothetical protein
LASILLLAGAFAPPCVAEAGDVTLRDVKIEQVGDKLNIAYTVENRSSDQIQLFNQLFRWGSFLHTVDANLAYTSLKDGTLEIRKAIAAIPHGVRVEAPEVPFLTILPPGDRYREQFTLSVPVRGMQPYRQPKVGSDQSRDVQLVVGWATGLSIHEEKTANGVAWATDPDQALVGQVLLIEEIEISVPTLMRDQSAN